MWVIYEFLLLVGLLLALPKALWRRRLPHRGWSMRLGRYSPQVAARLNGRPTVWIHAVSVGEVIACQPFVRQLAQSYPQYTLILSTITHSGFSIALKQLADQVIPIYFPLDFRLCVRRALEAIRPDLLVLVETELWPMMIRLAKRRGISIVVVNGRISPRAFHRYRVIRPWLRGLLGEVDRFLMQSQLDADRILQLGAPPERVSVVGSLKWEAGLAGRPRPEEIRTTASRLGLQDHSQVLVAGSTHRGEEALLLQAFKTLRNAHQDLRLVLAPRHLERLDEIEGLIRQAEWTPVRLSRVASPASWDVGLVDTFGTLPLYYGLASVVFVGGSLISHGGQNPIEPASLGRPIVFGPFMHNFSDIAHQLLLHQGARQLARSDQLLDTLQHVLADPAEAKTMGARAQALTERSQGATQRTLNVLKPLLTAHSSTT